jgi:hypothetical protein
MKALQLPLPLFQSERLAPQLEKTRKLDRLIRRRARGTQKKRVG